jgi:hypothetical protein
MESEGRVAVPYLLAAFAWPFAALNVAKVFQFVDAEHRYFAAIFGIAAGMALAASPLIFLGVYERLRRHDLTTEISLCASAAILGGVYVALWLFSLVAFGPFLFS